MNGRIYKGELYYADLKEGVGSEQSGSRPVLILQNNIGNRFSPTVIVAPITTSVSKHRIPTHVTITGFGLKTESTVLLEQIKTIDKKRLSGYIGKIDKHTFKNIEKAIKVSLGMT